MSNLSDKDLLEMQAIIEAQIKREENRENYEQCIVLQKFNSLLKMITEVGTENLKDEDIDKIEEALQSI